MAAGLIVCRLLLRVWMLVMVLVWAHGGGVNQHLERNTLKEAKTSSSRVDSSLVLLEVVQLRRDLHKSEENILEKLENTAKERKQLKQHIQSLENALSDKDEVLKRLNKLVDAQNVEIRGFETVIRNIMLENGKFREETANNWTAANQKLLNSIKTFEQKEDAVSVSIIDNVCKTRSIALPNGCDTIGCCLKQAFKMYDKCFPSCSRKCPAGYEVYKDDNFCYKFSTACMDWSSARSVCQNEGGDLIVLKDDRAVSYFMELAKKSNVKCTQFGPWLGASDTTKEGDWRWIDGTEVPMDKYWNPKEPNGGRRENYLHMYHQTSFRFNDAPHDLEIGFICAIQ